MNPVANATPPRRAVHDVRPPNPDEVLAIIDAAQAVNPALATYLLVSAASGIRRSEAVALRWSDIDFEAVVLLVRRGVVRGPDGLVEKDTKTHAARRIALDRGTLEVLRAHRERCDSVAAACGVVLAKDAFVFSASPDGSTPWQPENLTSGFRRLAKAVGAPSARLHDLRHFVATRLLANGVDVRTVAGRLGHKNPNVTLNVYAAFLPEADREAADVLGRLLERPSAG